MQVTPSSNLLWMSKHYLFCPDSWRINPSAGFEALECHFIKLKTKSADNETTLSH
jgi:hypothetical protein